MYLCSPQIKLNQMKQDIFNQYVEKVVDLFEIDRSLLFSKSKKRELVDARHMLYYLCAKRPMRVNYIQKYMAENGYEIQHSSVIHGITTTEKRLKEDKDYVNIINQVEKSVHI